MSIKIQLEVSGGILVTLEFTGAKNDSPQELFMKFVRHIYRDGGMFSNQQFIPFHTIESIKYEAAIND